MIPMQSVRTSQMHKSNEDKSIHSSVDMASAFPFHQCSMVLAALISHKPSRAFAGW